MFDTQKKIDQATVWFLYYSLLAFIVLTQELVWQILDSLISKI